MSKRTEIRITDPYIIDQVIKEQDKRRDATPTKTASRLINERLSQLELIAREKASDERSHATAQ